MVVDISIWVFKLCHDLRNSFLYVWDQQKCFIILILSI